MPTPPNDAKLEMQIEYAHLWPEGSQVFSWGPIIMTRRLHGPKRQSGRNECFKLQTESRQNEKRQHGALRRSCYCGGRRTIFFRSQFLRAGNQRQHRPTALLGLKIARRETPTWGNQRQHNSSLGHQNCSKRNSNNKKPEFTKSCRTTLSNSSQPQMGVCSRGVLLQLLETQCASN